MKVISFPIDVSDLSIANYLDDQEIYDAFFTASQTPQFYTSCLYRIIELEKITYRLITTTNNSDTKINICSLGCQFSTYLKSQLLADNWIIQKFFQETGVNSLSGLNWGQSLGSDWKKLEGCISHFDDVYGKDRCFLTESEKYKNLRVFVLTNNGHYLGHIYGWDNEIDEYCGIEDAPIFQMIGIRTSLENALFRTLGKGTRNIASHLIKEAIEFAETKHYKTIRVEEPYPSMQHILKQCGFDRVDRIGNYYFEIPRSEF